MARRLAIFLAILALSSAVLALPFSRWHRGGAMNHGLKRRGVDWKSLSQVEDGPTGPFWFTQKVDHFDPLNTNTYQQKYWANSTVYQAGGPVFVVIGGEGPTSPAYVSGHFVVNEYAEAHNALMLGLEHRFYGDSYPAEDMSTENLRLLSSQQALADLANFITSILPQYNAVGAKVVVWGGSYSGALSAWFRELYPEVAFASFGTSAPVFADLDFFQYAEVVQQSVGPACAAVIRSATDTISQLMSTADGRKQVAEKFNFCEAPASFQDVQTFFSALSDGVCETVQYSDDNRQGAAFDISSMCAVLTAPGNDDVTNYANFVAQYLKSEGETCLDVSYKNMIEELRNTTNGPDGAGRAWIWQTCTEFGYYQSFEGHDLQPFSETVTLQYYVQQCFDIYGLPLLPNTAATNRFYGGRNLNASRVILGNGSVDPWHALGIVTPIGNDNTVVYIDGGAHCSDLYASSPNDSAYLKAARAVETSTIEAWFA